MKLGLYYLPGIDSRAVQARLPVKNTEYTADEIIQCPDSRRGGGQGREKNCARPLANAFGSGFALNYSHPGSQMYIKSIVDGLYGWNVSFVKLDGLVPGSSFEAGEQARCSTHEDLAAWRGAIEERYEEWKHAGREKIWLVASWGIPVSERAVMDRQADSWRVEQDIEAYGERMTTFDRVIRNVKTAAGWTSIDQNRRRRGLIDLDSVLVSDLSFHEARSMLSFWAILGSPIYSGDDLARLPPDRKALLTNPEVLALARRAASNPARLDGFDLARAMLTANSAHGDGLESEERRAREEKRRMVVELSLFQNLSSQPAFGPPPCRSSACMNRPKSPEHIHIHSPPPQLPLASPLQRPAHADLWALQVWVLDLDPRSLVVAIVNVGDLLPSDAPVNIQFSLCHLARFQENKSGFMRGRGRRNQKAAEQEEDEAEEEEEEDVGEEGEKSYLVRDLWMREDIGVVELGSVIRFTLAVHATKLLQFSQI